MKKKQITQEVVCHNKKQYHHHHGDVTEQTIKYLCVSFFINIFLSCLELIGGVVSGSVSLIGDALHNTSDAFSILIAVIAFKVGRKKANHHYTYGFKRAEVVGGFVNLVLLFIAGCYLLVEGFIRLFRPEPIEGELIIGISLVALIVDAVTAKLSHADSHHNTNMRMVFVHNLADALGSVGVIISGVCVLVWGIFWIDGLVALCIAGYMIYHAVYGFLPIVRILMNAAPLHLNVDEIKNTLERIEGVCEIHHIHIWQINEADISFNCHIISENMEVVPILQQVLADKFGIYHSNIQVEKTATCRVCHL
ncbi:MAG: cation transporter [Alphaproteobacteria bacterium]|nr:cation transporter [Alphaproteobacteria bacterium]